MTEQLISSPSEGSVKGNASVMPDLGPKAADLGPVFAGLKIPGHPGGTVKAFPQNNRKRVSLFHGWEFVRFREGAEDTFAIMPIYTFDSPVIEYNPAEISLDKLENPTHAQYWLPLALDSMVFRVLIEAMGDPEERKGDLKGAGWDRFREEIVKHCDESLEAIIDDAMHFGVDHAFRYVTSCMYFESGLQSAVVSRQTGKPSLRSA